MNHKARLKLIERKISNNDTLTAILPDFLQYDGYQVPPLKKGERVIKPRGYLAYDPETGETFYEQ